MFRAVGRSVLRKTSHPWIGHCTGNPNRAAIQVVATMTTTTTTTTTTRRTFSVEAANTIHTGGRQIISLAKEHPTLDVVRYHHKNRTWTLQQVQYYSEALAIGIMENGFIPGDVVLSWLPEHFSEQMVLQFACSKAGLILHTLDADLATRDTGKAAEALAAALTITKANIFISQEAGSDVNYIRLAKQVIPELRFFSTTVGEAFVTPSFPHLRICVQTGFDQVDKEGFFRYRHMLVPSHNLDSYVDPAKVTADTPLAGVFELKDDIPVGFKVYSQAEVLKNNLWPTFCSILKREFHEVEGVGVVF